MLDQAFLALRSYDWGADSSVLKPIDDAVVSSRGDAAARAALEKQLAESLATATTHDAKDYICRKLMVIGSAAAVPALAALLPDPHLSHMARYALERIPAVEAGDALRSGLTSVPAPLQIGILSSLGVRGEDASVAAMSSLIGHADSAVARAAAYGLGAIRSAAAAQGLAQAKPAHETTNAAIIDASLACAENLLAHGKKVDALGIYKRYTGETHPKHIRLAATRGMLACAGKKES